MKKRKLKERLAAAEYRERLAMRRVTHLTEAIEDVYATGLPEEKEWAKHVLGQGDFQITLSLEMRKAMAELRQDLDRQLFGQAQ